MLKFKRLILILFLLLITCVKVNAEPVNSAFNDDNFYQCVIENYNYEYDTTFNLLHNLTDDELSEIKELTNRNKVCKNIINLNGIEKLINLEIINFGINTNTFTIENLDLKSNKNLQEIQIIGGNIENIDLSKVKDISYMLEGTNLYKIY